MATIDIVPVIPSLPEGWQGTPDDLLEFIRENATFAFDGDFATGQVGGARPTEDVGIYYSDTAIEKFNNGAYHPITDVPIGAMLPYASVTGSAPANYLFCQGQSLNRADYPDLFALLGVTWGSTSDTTFNLPDPRGRVPMGAGTGTYALPTGTTDANNVGSMRAHATGDYYGREWLVRRTDFPSGSPTAQMSTFALNVLLQGQASYVEDIQPSFCLQWIIRYR